MDFSQEGFEWINCDDSSASILSYIRKSSQSDDCLIAVCNFTPIARESHAVGVPLGGPYREIFNSDSEYYGGTNFGNQGLCQAEPIAADGQPFRLTVAVPPLGAIILKPAAAEQR